jgi:hypothetical protein
MKRVKNHFYMVYLVNEMTFNGYNPYSLDLLYIVAILLGILVIISKNPIVSVLFLIGLFLCISVYLILTGLNFIGLSYLLVYIGAVKNRMVRSLRSKWAAWVRIPLYKVLLIINNFLFKTMFYKNKLPCLKFKRATRLAFAYIFF